jgi:hypothetical protein
VSTPKAQYQGGCLCGAVRYAARAEPLVVRACWCRVCQYFAAGNATVNLAFATEAVTITGELRDYASTADSGNHMHRRFCPRCGVQVTSAADERPQFVVIRAGTLDEPGRIAPQMLIWTSAAPGWAALDPALPQHTGQPPAPAPR